MILKKLSVLLTFIFTLGLASISSAGFMVEPYLGMETGAQVGTLSNGIDFGAKASATSLGLRLGYKLPVLAWFALDYQMASGGKIKFDNSGILDVNYTRSVLFGTVGVDLPFLLRGWAGIGLTDELKVDSTGTSDKLTGSATKLGLGFTFLPFVSLNLEYILHKFNSTSGTSGTSFDALYSKLENNMIQASISLPLNL